MKLFRKSDVPLSQQQITEWLRELRGHPFNSSSNFDVTAVFRVKYNNDDTYYFAGVNVENTDHRLSTHAEEGCISAMATAFGKKAEIVEGWLMGAPRDLKQGDDHFLANNKVTCCGKCRQQIVGLASPNVVIHSISLNGDHKQTTVGQFLPEEFSFRQFDPEAMNAGVSATRALSTDEIQNKLIRRGETLSKEQIFEWLKQLESIDYATKTGQAAILKLKDGSYIAGVNVEEAAFVSINAIQNAIAIAHTCSEKVEVDSVWTLSHNKTQHLNKTPAAGIGTLPQFSAFKQMNERSSADNSFSNLTLSAVQVLGQFAVNLNIPIHMLNNQGEAKTIPLSESAQYVPILPPATTPAPKRSASLVM